MTIFVLRHGETYANVDKRYSGFSESKLTEKGKLQIENIKEILLTRKFDKVYCSPSSRTRETAEILGVEYIIDENLREINFGIFLFLLLSQKSTCQRVPLKINMLLNDSQ